MRYVLRNPNVQRLFVPALLFCALLTATVSADPARPRNTQSDQTWLPPIVGSYVEQPFGGKSCHGGGKHRGADLLTRKETGVVAPADGLVIVSAVSDHFFPGLNNLIVIDHGDGTTTVFANLGERLVNAGESVRRGQRIAMTQKPDEKTRTASTHVELVYRGKAIDPFKRLPYVFFDLQLPPSKNAYKNAPE